MCSARKALTPAEAKNAIAVFSQIARSIDRCKVALLAVGTMAALALYGETFAIPERMPRSAEDVKTIFQQLCVNFKVEQEVGMFLIEQGLESLEDFVHYFVISV